MFTSHTIVTEQLEARRLLSATMDTPPVPPPPEPGVFEPGKELIYELHGVVPGDANGDDIVNLIDFGILAAFFGSGPGMTVAEGDFNGDGFVNLPDLNILAANFGFGLGPETLADGSDELLSDQAPTQPNPLGLASAQDPTAIHLPELPAQTD